MTSVVQELERAIEAECWLTPLGVGSQAIRLSCLPALIGRGSDADVRLDDVYVSRRHCEIVRAEDGLMVHDLGSKNGTFVNGVRVELSPLRPDDLLAVGGMRFMVQAGCDRQIA
jgi:predicted component of type VI protein secretion system